MTRAQLRAELQATGFGVSTADVTSQNYWLDAAYTWVWNAADWSFLNVDQASLAVTVGDDTPTMPGDLGVVRWILDDAGSELEELEPRNFDDLYRPGVIDAVRATPSSFKVVNRIVTLGPVPDATKTFTWSYERRVSHYQSDGVTVASGTMGADADIPLWPADHHQVLVWAAATVGHGARSSPAAATMQALRDDALAAMEADIAVSLPVARQMGSYSDAYGDW